MLTSTEEGVREINSELENLMDVQTLGAPVVKNARAFLFECIFTLSLKLAGGSGSGNPNMADKAKQLVRQPLADINKGIDGVTSDDIQPELLKRAGILLG